MSDDPCIFPACQHNGCRDGCAGDELPPLPNDLIEAIGAYWDTGYEEGKCGIGGDAANECLAAVYERVRDYARAAVLQERERICAAIKAEDDYCVTQGDYMLDSDDCIKVARGQWIRPDYSIAERSTK